MRNTLTTNDPHHLFRRHSARPKTVPFTPNAAR